MWFVFFNCLFVWLELLYNLKRGDLLKKGCYPFASLINKGGSQYAWKPSWGCMILNKVWQGRTILFIMLCRRFLYNLKNLKVHIISFSNSSRTSILCFSPTAQSDRLMLCPNTTTTFSFPPDFSSRLSHFHCLFLLWDTSIKFCISSL